MKVISVAVEVFPVGTKPPAAVGERISKNERHDLGAASPLSTTTPSLQGRVGGSPIIPELVELVFGRGSTRQAEKLFPRIACTTVAAPSVRSRVLVFAGPSASMTDVAAERHAPAVSNADRYFFVPVYIFPSYRNSCYRLRRLR